MKLSTKVNLIVAITVFSIMTTIFLILANRYEKLINDDLLQITRAFYKNIVITRSWVAQHEGVYVVKSPSVRSNPYLANPDINTKDERTLTLKNPAVVTRELSELSRQMSGNFQFHITSLKPVNPNNSPNNFEVQALKSFENKTPESKYLEYYRTEQINNKPYFRYFGPLFTEVSCMNCHAVHGYKVGDVRGGISIILPLESIEQAKQKNYFIMVLAGLIAIFVITLVINFLLHRIVIKPVQIIENATKELEDGNFIPIKVENNDEIGDLAGAFQSMQKKIQTSTKNLQQSEEKYRTLINCSAEAVLIISDKNRIVDANNSITELSQYKVEEILNNPADILFAAPAKKLKNKERYETILKCKDGTTKPIEIYISSENFMINNQANFSLFYLHDLSERKRMEKIMIDTEKMFALNQLSSGIAHEIRNPLFSVRNNLNYIKEKSKNGSEMKKVHAEIDTGIHRINTLVNSILDYARPHNTEFKMYHIKKVIDRSLELVGKQFEKSQHEIIVNIPKDIPQVELDPHKMEQVFINLSTNSLQAMTETGNFSISAKHKKNHIEITISDNGCGINKKEISRIFDPFFTRKSNGTGLGLSIVKNIVKQHNGEIFVKSRQDQGTTFTIILPIVQG